MGAPEASPHGSPRRGGQRKYSELAIETALTLRLLFHLPLRQTEGFLTALFGPARRLARRNGPDVIFAEYRPDKAHEFVQDVY